MSRICENCKYYEPISVHTKYSESYDAHCLKDGSLIHFDDVCDLGSFVQKD